MRERWDLTEIISQHLEKRELGSGNGGVLLGHGRETRDGLQGEKRVEPTNANMEGTSVGKRGPQFESGLMLEDNIEDHFSGNLPDQGNGPIPMADAEPPDPDESMELMGLSDVEALLLEQSEMNALVVSGTEVKTDLSGVQLRG